MSGINTGILTNAYPLSTNHIKELEAKVLNGEGSFVYLDENSKLCFAMHKGVNNIKELAWDNAYELTNAGNLLTKRAYKKTGLKTFALDSTYTKSSLNASWTAAAIPVFEFDGIFTGNEFDQGPTDPAGNYGGYGGINGQCCFVKVSDRVFTYDELLGSTLCINRKGEDEFLEITANNIVNLSTPEECAFVVHNNEFSIACVYVVPSNDFEPPKTSGTYFMFIDGLDVETPDIVTSIYTKSLSCLTIADAINPTTAAERPEGDGSVHVHVGSGDN